ncbi:MAG: phosphate uptake regulator PhoU [Nitrospinae bacterium]|nr:phosphate uptake regulator PhoU [Nitrospinota bacterium]
MTTKTVKILSILEEKGIEKNFNFLLIDVIKQVEDTLKVLHNPTGRLIKKVSSRDDYIDNLKSVIGHKCFSSNMNRKVRKKEVDVIQAIHIITNNLERIADHSVNIVSQVSYLNNNEFVKKYDFQEMLDHVISSLKTLTSALKSMDISIALRICKSEFLLDDIFKTNFKIIIEELKKGEETENLVTTLFILRYIERMGDCLLNIGEALISAVLGEKLKIADFHALEDSMKNENKNINMDMEQITIEAITETKSGCKIKKIKRNDLDQVDGGVIFKDGNPEKLVKEKEKLELWEEISPGLPPKIFSYKNHGDYASILLEYLTGITFQNIVIDSNKQFLEESFEALKETNIAIWEKTMTNTPSNPGFINQLKSRLDDIYRVHPEFEDSEKQIGSLKTRSFRELVDICEPFEEELSCPFSVLIHGDFNIDNIIYDHEKEVLHYIDLNRSCQQDYVQDISVFLVSNFRLPIFLPRIRDVINDVVRKYFLFVKRFAKKHNDTTLEARLAFGLVRSFTTSTRFEFNADFASAMYLRANYLLERLYEHHGKPWEEFSLPDTLLNY